MSDLSEKDIARLAEAMMARRAELKALDALSREARAPVSLDQQSVGRLSRIDAMQQQAMAQAEERRRQLETARIDAALRRIDTGEYGWCIACGEAIAPKRLEIDPSVATCINCTS